MHVDQYFEKEGVRLETDKLEKEPGLRALAKLFLSSLMGKFGELFNLKQSLLDHGGACQWNYQAVQTNWWKFYVGYVIWTKANWLTKVLGQTGHLVLSSKSPPSN